MHFDKDKERIIEISETKRDFKNILRGEEGEEELEWFVVLGHYFQGY